MPIGLVSSEDFARELESLSGGKTRTPEKESHPVSESVVVDILPSHGRNEGDTNVPDDLRKIIGEEALLNGRRSALTLARGFGISDSSVSAYTKGATSTTTYNSPAPSLTTHLNKARTRAVKRASKTLNSALEAINQEKLDYADAKDLSGIAKDMSVIIKNLEPQAETTSGAATPQFVIYAPQFKDERSFEIIQTNE